jgi:hypothetical protein
MFSMLLSKLLSELVLQLRISDLFKMHVLEHRNEQLGCASRDYAIVKAACATTLHAASPMYGT